MVTQSHVSPSQCRKAVGEGSREQNSTTNSSGAGYLAQDSVTLEDTPCMVT